MIAEARDAEAAGAIIARAFHDDPVNRWVFGARPMAPTFTALARHLYLARGFGHMAGGDGATLWLMDACDKDAGLIATLKVAAALGLSAGLGAMRRGLALDTVFSKAHPPQPHAFLFAVGVVPEAQGKGLGGALIRAGLERVDTAGLPCYLESTKERNLPLYRHFGFQDLPLLAAPRGCPPVWPMWRPAKAA